MSFKVYVGNLPFNISDEELRETFAPYGEVEEVTIIKDKFSGQKATKKVEFILER